MAYFLEMQNIIYQTAARLGQKLHSNGLKVAIAESCTGGGVAHAVTSVSGSSHWFEVGCVTYSNDAKIRLLDVQTSTLEAFGAVSQETVSEMLQGVIALSGADMGIAVSGIAGPTGATSDKAVGTICFAWGSNEGYITNTQNFTGDREDVRNQSILFVLERLLDHLG